LNFCVLLSLSDTAQNRRGELEANDIRAVNRNAALYALASAALFGASTPAAKLLLGAIDPFVLAGLLYSGAGIGIFALRRLMPLFASDSSAPQVTLTPADVPWLGAAIAAGGVAGPLLLMLGLSRTEASTTSLLLALIAWFVFRESFNRRLLLGMACLIAGAILVSWTGPPKLENIFGPLSVFTACIAWGIDNNLTRKVSQADPLQIVQLKGLIAGPLNVAIGIWTGGSISALPSSLVAGAIGFFGYGVSLVLYVIALRHIGAARTGAYFSTAPFLGAAISVVALGDPLTPRLFAAGGLMALGVWLHLTERHEHRHVHFPMRHAHPHIHDEHHQHDHKPTDPTAEPHTHWHEHGPLAHTHPHTPDAHHTHRH
jgi:drug/metabolite transporter (DMT)-like permease